MRIVTAIVAGALSWTASMLPAAAQIIIERPAPAYVPAPRYVPAPSFVRPVDPNREAAHQNFEAARREQFRADQEARHGDYEEAARHQALARQQRETARAYHDAAEGDRREPYRPY